MGNALFILAQDTLFDCFVFFFSVFLQRNHGWKLACGHKPTYLHKNCLLICTVPFKEIKKLENMFPCIASSYLLK